MRIKLYALQLIKPFIAKIRMMNSDFTSRRLRTMTVSFVIERDGDPIQIYLCQNQQPKPLDVLKYTWWRYKHSTRLIGLSFCFRGNATSSRNILAIHAALSKINCSDDNSLSKQEKTLQYRYERSFVSPSYCFLHFPQRRTSVRERILCFNRNTIACTITIYILV